MLLALALAVGIAEWVPARWTSADPKSLELLEDSPVNCLLLEPGAWSAAFASEASRRGLVTLGVVRPEAQPLEGARRALETGLTGIILEGAFQPEVADSVRRAGAGKPLLELPPRRGMRLHGDTPLAGTYQGLWPGIQAQEGGAAKARPTGGPWIDTNSGFLRFLKVVTPAPLWVANRPPEKTVLPVERYLNAISDAEMLGARWVLALDEDFSQRLWVREERALKDWRRISAHLRFYEEHREWRALKPYSRLAVVEDAARGSALLSRGILDMFIGRHIPVRPIPADRLDKAALRGIRMAVAVDSSLLNDAQKEALKDVGRAGGTLLTGPPGWKFSPPADDRITLPDAELERITDVWQGINSVVGRGNLGVRLFNVSGMLSSLLGDPETGPVVLHLVNFTSYPIENVTVHLLDKFKQARLYSPEQPTRELEPYPVESGVGVDIDRVGVCAVLVLN